MSESWRDPILVGDRVTLRPIGASVQGVWDQVNDADGAGPAATTSTTRDQNAVPGASNEEHDERLELAIIDHSTGAWAGDAVLDDYDRESNSASLRIALRGPGRYDGALGTEATTLLVDHALRTMGLDQITAAALAGDARARRAYETTGFREVGRRNDGGEDWVEMAVARSHLSPDYPVFTERLELRPIEPERDLLAIHSYRSREDVCRYVPFTPGTREQLAQRLDDPERTRSVIDAEGQVLSLVIERRDTGELIGDLVLFWHSATHGHAEIGYVIHPDQSGQGFATEAAAALLALAFDGLGAHRVTARVDERNSPSARVVERLGMRREATHVESEWFKGEWTTMLVYAILRREWQRRQPGGD